MSALLRAVDAELLKTKRTLALTLIVVMPLALCLLNLAILLQDDDTSDVWESLLGNAVILWGILMLPLFITLETALVAALDHNAQGWKHLFALPLPRWSIYMAKQIVNLALIAGSMVVMLVGTMLTGVGLQVLGGRVLPVFPWGTLVHALTLLFLASWLMIAIHTWVSLRWHSFTVASTVGIVATVAGFLVINSEKYSVIFPWSLHVRVAGAVIMNMPGLPLSLALGVVGGIVFALVACWDVTRRDVL